MSTSLLTRRTSHWCKYSLAPLLLTLFVFFSACAKKETELVVVRLKNGMEYPGTLVSRDEKTVTVILPGGDARTFLNRQVESVVTAQPVASAAASAGKTAARPAAATTKPGARTNPVPLPAVPLPASGSVAPQTPVAFVAPESGRITLRAGTMLYLRPRQVIGAGPAQFKDIYGARLLDNVEGDGGVLPADSNLTMEIQTVPGTNLQKMQCRLVAVFPGAKEYRPAGGAVNLPVLGLIVAPPPENLPAAIRDLPYRLTASSLITFKLEKAITLQEVK